MYRPATEECQGGGDFWLLPLRTGRSSLKVLRQNQQRPRVPFHSPLYSHLLFSFFSRWVDNDKSVKSCMMCHSNYPLIKCAFDAKIRRIGDRLAGSSRRIRMDRKGSPGAGSRWLFCSRCLITGNECVLCANGAVRHTLQSASWLTRRRLAKWSLCHGNRFRFGVSCTVPLPISMTMLCNTRQKPPEERQIPDQFRRLELKKKNTSVTGRGEDETMGCFMSCKSNKMYLYERFHPISQKLFVHDFVVSTLSQCGLCSEEFLLPFYTNTSACAGFFWVHPPK